MAMLLDFLGQAARTPTWLDDADYTTRLLAGGQPPLLNAAEYVAFRRKAHGLLRPDFFTVPIGRIARAWVEAHPALGDQMRLKKRVVAPIRTLLADEGLRAYLVELVNALRGAMSGALLVLTMPSPRAWVRDAFDWAHGAGSSPEVGGDEADQAAVYLAECLRIFGESDIQAVLLEESIGHEPTNDEQIEWYQPVTNIANHYRWDLGLLLPSADNFQGSGKGVHFAIAPRAIGELPSGTMLPVEFWEAPVPPPPGPLKGFRYAQVPANGVPEAVLERLGTLR